MSNTSVSAPRYCRHKASGQAVVRLADRDIYLGKYGSAASKEAYRRIVSEWTHYGGRILSGSGGITVAEVMAAYLRHAKTYYRKGGKTTSEYDGILSACRFVRMLYSRTPAREFGPKRLQAVREEMIDAKHCRTHINKNIDRVRRMLKWAAGEEMIPASVPQALSMVAGLRKGRTNAIESEPVMPVADTVIDQTLPQMPEVVADTLSV